MTNLHHQDVQKVILVKYKGGVQAVVTTPHSAADFDAAIEELRTAIDRAADTHLWELADYRSDPLADVVRGCIQ